MANARVKSTKKVDYDKVFEERQAKLGGAPVQAKQGDDSTKNMSKAAKGMVLEQEAEKGLAN